MRPWVMQMEALDVVPRCLADDLTFTTYGLGHRARCIRAMRENRQYFKDIGARVADNKCFTFATDQRTRTMLSTMDWDGNGLKIPVKNSFRDLGAHINLTKACNGSTLTSRLIKATNVAKRLRWLPISREQKEKIVQANILPMALYGVEAIHVNQSALQSLRSAITRAIGPGSAKRSIDFTFFHSKCANDLDPETNILYLCAAGLRRVIAKHAGMHPLVKRIIRKIKIAQAIENPDDYRNTHMHGPVGLFMQELDQLGYSMDEHLNIFAPNELTIQLWHMPWQHIRKAITAIGIISFRARRIDPFMHMWGKLMVLPPSTSVISLDARKGAFICILPLEPFGPRTSFKLSVFRMENVPIVSSLWLEPDMSYGIVMLSRSTRSFANLLTSTPTLCLHVCKMALLLLSQAKPQTLIGIVTFARVRIYARRMPTS